MPETSSEEDYAENNPYDYDIDSSYEGDNYDPDNSVSADEEYQENGDDESTSDEDSNYQPEPYYGEVIKGKTYTNSDEYYQDVKAFNYVDLFPSVKMDFS